MERLRCCRGVCFTSLVALLLVRLTAVCAGQVDGTVIFVDGGRQQQFLRTDLAGSETEVPVFSYSDVVASVAVLLGVIPPSPLSGIVASKLDSLVAPDPFHRPRAVLSLNFGGVESDLVTEQQTLEGVHGAKSYQLRSLTTKDSHSYQLSGDDVTLKVLPRSDAVYKDAMVSEQEVKDMECLMGGSCASGRGSKSMTGNMIWYLNVDETFTLDLSVSAHQVFLKKLVDLFRTINQTVASCQAVEFERPAYLYFGTFDGIMELQEQYGNGPRTQLASKFLLHAVTKFLQYLQANNNDELVGIFTFTKTIAENDGFKITTSERSARILQAEAPAAGNETYPEQMALQLADRAIVFFTVIILIVSLLLSTCCLFTMPVTRDSLLYSGVKLD